VTTVMGPKLLELLRLEAPFVELVIRPDSRIDLTEQIDLGQLDGAIGAFSDVPRRFRSSSLFSYDDVLIASSSQKLGRLSLEALSNLSIAVISLPGDDEGIVDGFVSERGLAQRAEMYDRAALEQAFSRLSCSPRTVVSLPHFLALPALLESTDLTAIVPRPLATSLARTHALSTYELPYETAAVDVSVLCHERTTRDAPQEWLRDLLRRATEPLRNRSAEFDNPVRPISRFARSETAVARLVPRRASPTGKVAGL
jgi:DNA-binding transcriptional LysR family regulator